MTAAHPSVPENGADEHATGHHDSILLDEPTTADLRAKVTEAWQDFARALAARLRRLPTGAHVELTLDPTASGTGDAIYSVSLQLQDAGQILAQAVGNAVLPEGYRLDRASVADMVALGWSPPGVLTGSGEHFGLRSSVDESVRLATTVSRTMRDVYGAPHPAFLVFLVHDAADEPLAAEPLGTARPEILPDRPRPDRAAVPTPRSATGEPDVAGNGTAAGTAAGTAGGVGAGAKGGAGGGTGTGAEAGPEAGGADGPTDDAAQADHPDEEAMGLSEKVRTVVAAMLRTPADQLQLDSDGDINIRAGSAMVFVRVRDNPPLVDVFSPVLTEVEPTEQLYIKLSELTNRMPIGRLYCADDTVWASVPVFGRNFQATHLMLAVQVMTGLADELDDRLHGEFGGRRFFVEADKSASRGQQEPRTGMYL